MAAISTITGKRVPTGIENIDKAREFWGGLMDLVVEASPGPGDVIAAKEAVTGRAWDDDEKLAWYAQVLAGLSLLPFVPAGISKARAIKNIRKLPVISEKFHMDKMQTAHKQGVRRITNEAVQAADMLPEELFKPVGDLRWSTGGNLFAAGFYDTLMDKVGAEGLFTPGGRIFKSKILLKSPELEDMADAAKASEPLYNDVLDYINYLSHEFTHQQVRVPGKLKATKAEYDEVFSVYKRKLLKKYIKGILKGKKQGDLGLSLYASNPEENLAHFIGEYYEEAYEAGKFFKKGLHTKKGYEDIADKAIANLRETGLPFQHHGEVGKGIAHSSWKKLENQADVVIEKMKAEWKVADTAKAVEELKTNKPTAETFKKFKSAIWEHKKAERNLKILEEPFDLDDIFKR